MREDRYIGKLLEKYFEGLTSLFEEKELREYFQQEEILESLEKYRPIFAFFSNEIEEKRRETGKVVWLPASRRKWIQWASAGIAATVLLLLGIKLGSSFTEKPVLQSYVYINGVRYTELSIIQSETLHILDNFTELDKDILSSQIEMLDDFF